MQTERMWFRNWATRSVLIHNFGTYAPLAASDVADGNDFFSETKRSAAKLLSKDEARRIAANIAKLPEPFNQKAAVKG
jgi:DNA-directed RNA polymerase specialized sigma24 family protein